MIRAIAVDDELLALSVIENFCSQVGEVTLEKTFNRPTEALRHLEKFPVDLIFLDINMPSLNGIDFYKSVKQNTMVIFTTAYSEFAVEGFNLKAIDYLVKPFTFERFQQGIEKAMEYAQLMQQKSKDDALFIYIRADYALHKIAISDILFVEGLDDYLKIHISNHKPIVARLTMKAMLEKLPPALFARVHRSFIIPIKRIESIRNKIIHLAGESIPIGASYEESFMKMINT